MYLAAKVECGEIVRCAIFTKGYDALKRIKEFLMADNVIINFDEFCERNTSNFMYEILGDDKNAHIVYQVRTVYRD